MKYLLNFRYTPELRKPASELKLPEKQSFTLKWKWKKWVQTSGMDVGMKKFWKPLSTSIACNWTIKWIHIEMWLIFVCYRKPTFHIHYTRYSIHLNASKMTFSIEWSEKVSIQNNTQWVCVVYVHVQSAPTSFAACARSPLLLPISLSLYDCVELKSKLCAKWKPFQACRVHNP